MAYREFVSLIHKSTKRDYLARVTACDKAEVAERALRWDYDYWDGSRETGYGGYRYDGRWRKVADALVAAYDVRPGDRILDVGAGKGFLLHDLREAVPGIDIAGIDISAYAIEHAMPSVKPGLMLRSAAETLPFSDDHFDLVISITTLHNLYIHHMFTAFREIERVGKKNKFIVVEAYQTERQKMNLLYWQLTCRAFHTPEEWEWIMQQTGYTGDHEFIFFD
jgi:ubiquinone/menaquinone biosynthesis C-methylase UbiE